MERFTFFSRCRQEIYFVMQEAIAKAQALVEAHQYIRRFENKLIVVKIGGSIMDDPENLRTIVQDVCFMDAVGMRPVLVHGGGKSITEAMKSAGLEAQFVHGRRYTDERTLAIAEHELVKINRGIVEQIDAFEHKGVGLNSLASNVIFAKRLFLSDPSGKSERRIDIGYVGEIESINAPLIKALAEGEYIPVIAPIAGDAAGNKLNCNADSVAGHVAGAIRAEKLILVSDTHGIRTKADDPSSLASSLTKSQIEELIKSSIITAGMLPKVEASLIALECGVTKAHIIDGRIPHSLLLEIYTEAGIGTEITL